MHRNPRFTDEIYERRVADDERNCANAPDHFLVSELAKPFAPAALFCCR
ncbi:hypothetical protein RX327_28755 [Bradyrhizobium sp. BEA-2-5]|nr:MULTISPECIES: hypothetical protein [Bradyrhizobium]WOH79811.1 hypothetical protein RX327_28755 [Bradyrhizobium sp. BEA-2-5]